MSDNTMQTGSAYMAGTLHGYGITHVFLMESMLLHTLVELEERGVQQIISHSEKAAAYMADGYARASRRPAVCMSQSVGAANLASGLQDARLSCSPVIAITGKKPPLFQHRHSYQELDHGQLFAAVTKYHAHAAEPEQVPLYLRQCFREACSGRPGPVHLDIPNHSGEIFDAARAAFDTTIEGTFSQLPALRPQPDPRTVRLLAERLRQARRPVLVVGNGAAISGADGETLALAERGLPVASSVDGKGLLSDAHPLYIGPVGEYHRTCANALVSRADLVIYAGCGINDQLTLNWTIPAPGTAVAQIDICMEELGRNVAGVLPVFGDARATLRALLAELDGWQAPADWTEDARAAAARWLVAHAPRFTSEATPIQVERLCRELSDFLPERSVLVSDTGFSAVWASAFVRLTRPGQRFLRPGGGSLGWGFPASLGVKCALPNHPVFCFTGDGGFWYHLAEMETAARYHIRTVTVLNNNGGLGQCRERAERAHEGSRIRPEGFFMYRPTHFARIAEEMGCLGIRVERPEDIRPALEQALAADRPALVEVLTDMDCDPRRQQAV